MLSRRSIAFVAWIWLTGTGSAATTTPARLIPPVDAAISVGFQAPQTDWGPGHRGIDYSVATGTAVRAAASGMVTFAGSVAGWLAVTIAHSEGLETSYSRLSSISVTEGQSIEQGRWIGRVGSGHGSGGGLHFSVRSNGVYVDPVLFLAPLDEAGAYQLAPLQWRPEGSMPVHLAGVFGAGTNEEACRPPHEPESSFTPPNDNIAVAIAGVGSHTFGTLAADIYEHGPEELGYLDELVYRFSYRGTQGPRLHAPYHATETSLDIRVAARKLRALLVRIAERHPRRDVDLIAHSQGGIVARVFLEYLARAARTGLPHVEHLVTFASPHRGSPMAGEVAELDNTLSGGTLLDAISRVARAGADIPDPRGPSIGQLAPGSELLDGLASHDVTLGTRVLSLAIANDAIVPADRAMYDGRANRVVGPEAFNGHSAIVSSPAARSIAHAFLRDAPLVCRGPWDLWGPRAGRAIGFLEGRVDDVYGALEQVVGTSFVGRVGRVLRAERALPRAGD